MACRSPGHVCFSGDDVILIADIAAEIEAEDEQDDGQPCDTSDSDVGSARLVSDVAEGTLAAPGLGDTAMNAESSASAANESEAKMGENYQKAGDLIMDLSEKQEAAAEVATGTWLHTIFSETDWSGPEIPLAWFLRPETFILPMSALAGANIPAWFDATLYEILVLLGFFFTGMETATAWVPMQAMQMGLPRTSVPIMVTAETLLCMVSAYIFNSNVFGLLLAIVSFACCSCCCSCAGHVSSRRVRYFLSITVWFVLTQVGLFAFFRLCAPALLIIANQFLGSFLITTVSVVYGAVANTSLWFLNRRFLPYGVPVDAALAASYMVVAATENMKIFGFLPKVHSHLTTTQVARGIAGAATSSALGDLARRCFVFQRFQYAIEKRMCKKVPPLRMRPEMDAAIRSEFSVARAAAVHFYLGIAFALPGGATWTTNPTVWISPMIVILLETLVDLVVVKMHRVWYPIDGETWLGTRARLMQPFQHWPPLQSDGGAAYRAAAAAAKTGGAATQDTQTQSSAVKAALQVKWSKNPYFTDLRLAVMSATALSVHVLAVGLTVTYGPCRIWYPPGYDVYGLCE